MWLDNYRKVLATIARTTLLMKASEGRAEGRPLRVGLKASEGRAEGL